MVRVVPFRGLTYNPAKVRDLSHVVSPPYDVITPEEQEKLYRRSRRNVVRLILSRDPDPYHSAARVFEKWQEEGVLVRSERPAVYFVSHRFQDPERGEKERLGFVALARMEDGAESGIHPHEKTFEAPKEDRFRLMVACRANLDPVFALYSEPKGSSRICLRSHLEDEPPIGQTQDQVKESCRLWAVTDTEVIRALQREMEGQPLLIADGHHRYEAAVRYRNRLRSERKNWTGQESFNFVMMYFVNMKEEGLSILPTHRLIRAFRPIAFAKLEEALQRFFYLEPYPKTEEGRRWFLRALKTGGKRQHRIGASFKGDPRYLILRLKNKRTMQRLAGGMSPEARELDVTILHLLILEHIVGLSSEEQTGGAIRYLHEDAEAWGLWSGVTFRPRSF